MVLMIEQTDRTFTPLSSPDGGKTTGRIEKKDLRVQANPESEIAEEKLKKGGKSAVDLHLALDPESDVSDTRRRSPILRIKLADHSSFPLTPTDSESKLERKKAQYSQFSKANAQYHKLFKEISNDEILKQSYTCALQKDILYQGKLFVSDNWICFHSKVFGRDTKITIPVLSITLIKKTKTALLVPNALVITTSTERHLFVSFLSRDTTYKFLLSVCTHLHTENAGGTPVTSSAENSFRMDCPSSLPLDFSADFSDLDGVVRQRRQDMLDSSSSGSQTPDYEKMDGPIKVTTDANQQEKLLPPMSLNTLLLVYLFLVCVLVMSSCYMAFKILALEQRLNSLGPSGDYSHENALYYQSQSASSSEIYGELSTNLFKLEKIQKNLRKLLEGS
ncbi:GRAM domain-containing protein 2B-like isoform 2-T2 [Clarias gariepinus]|uniref:GRAM domain-containing protein 2B-like isoform X2 n=1 Tax=Clarias gariepinus TaxID=13013 RepID=UPI00234D7982|nr:GRAM domain-containing protein 2B-like isoform X2 [Clarias gariepinus]